MTPHKRLERQLCDAIRTEMAGGKPAIPEAGRLVLHRGDSAFDRGHNPPAINPGQAKLFPGGRLVGGLVDHAAGLGEVALGAGAGVKLHRCRSRDYTKER